MCTNQFSRNKICLIHIDIQFTTLVCHDIMDPPYDHSTSCPTDHHKQTNSNSSTRWIGLTHVTNSYVVAHISWVVRCFPTGFIANRGFHYYHSFNPHHSQSSQHSDFSLPASPSSFLFFKWLQIFLHISLQLALPHPHIYSTPCPSPANHCFFTTCTGVEENLSTPGVRQRNLKLIALPHLINTRNKKKSWSHSASWFLWVKPRTKWCDSS